MPEDKPQPRTNMQFSMKEWRRTYDMVQQLGQTLCDSRPTYTEIGDYIAPKIVVSLETQAMIENRILSLTQRSNKYLDQCGMRPNRPLWHYDRKNKETHASEPEFKYQHLMENSA